jgi:hypothetical protein
MRVPSSSGKALLATMADLEIDRLLSESPLPDSARMTHRQRNGLLADIRLIRKRGYAKQKEEFVDGISAVATPVLTAGGRALAALSIASPSSRFDEVRWSSLLLPGAARGASSKRSGTHVRGDWSKRRTQAKGGQAIARTSDVTLNSEAANLTQDAGRSAQ